MGHTPGPWRVSHDEHEPYWNIDMPRQDGSSWYGHGNAMVYTTEIDARLIAAAPELLAACRCALADMEGIMPEFDADLNDHPGWQTIQELKDVIAKAEGRRE